MGGKIDTSSKTLLVYNTIDTSPGQSGSPIISKKLKIIGIHTTGGGGYNWGTKFTIEILQWVAQIIDEQIVDGCSSYLIKTIEKIFSPTPRQSLIFNFATAEKGKDEIYDCGHEFPKYSKWSLLYEMEKDYLSKRTIYFRNALENCTTTSLGLEDWFFYKEK